MVLHATFNNISVISWKSVLLVEETGVSGENHEPAVMCTRSIEMFFTMPHPHHCNPIHVHICDNLSNIFLSYIEMVIGFSNDNCIVHRLHIGYICTYE